MSLTPPSSGQSPQVAAAWHRLLTLDVGLPPPDATLSSDSARRVYERLCYLRDHRTDGFLNFVRDEEERAEAAQTRGESSRGALRRRVAPLFAFEGRVEAAIALADKEAEAVFEMPGLSQSLERDRERRTAGRLTPEEVAEAGEGEEEDMGDVCEEDAHGRDVNRMSPSKRSFSHDKSAGNTSATKRLRAALPTASLPRLALSGSDSSASAASYGTTPSTPLSTDCNAFGGNPFSVPPARPDDERYVLITKRNRYRPYMSKIMSFHAQYELEYELHRPSTVGWEHVTMKDLDQVGSLGARRVVRSVEARVNGTEPADTEDDVKLRMLRLEAEREDEDIASGAKNGLGNASREWPYGGKIAYTFLVEAANGVNPGVEIMQVGEMAGASWSPRKSATAGPIDEPENPLGPLAARARGQLGLSVSILAPKLSGKSTRLARRFGSRRVITFKMSKKLRAKDKVDQLFAGRVLLILGRTYRAFWATPDGDSVFAVETGDALPDRTVRLEPPMPSFEELMSRYNDLEQKSGQAMAKWAARPQILFSDTVPIMRVEPMAVAVAPDLVATSAQDLDDPATEEILTDGCGLMSNRVANMVQMRMEQLGLAPPGRPRPSAIQMRFGGSKGMLLLMSAAQHQEYPDKEIVLRPSMIKSRAHPIFESDPSLLTLDLVGCSSLKTSVSLSSEPMPILRHLGVPRSVFREMQEESLSEIGTALAPFAQDDETEAIAAERLRVNVYRLGGVAQEQKKRRCVEAGQSVKVAGLVSRRSKADDSDDEDATTASDAGTVATEYHEVNQLSGLPNSVAESLYLALSAGFTVQTSAFVRHKLRSLVQTLTDSVVMRYKIPVKQSLSAYIVPDPSGTLGPDEIFIKFSDPGASSLVDPSTGCALTHLEGEVLALRSPCKLPSDIRKMRTVYRPELAHLQDVIVMSADSNRCSRSPASMLAGGDYDGDTVQLFWDPKLVQPFRNAPDHFADVPDDFVRDNFAKSLVKGDAFLVATKDVPEESRVLAMQRFLLGGLEGDVLTGQYSEMHGVALYELGVDHPKTVRLARIFCHVLDARKSGLRILREVWKKDRATFSRELEWRNFKKGKGDNDPSCNMRARRPRNMGGFILDELRDKGVDFAKDILSRFALPDGVGTDDAREMAAPYRYLRAYMTSLPPGHLATLEAEMEGIERHVRACFSTWQRLRGPRPLMAKEVYQNFYDERSNLPRTPLPPRTPSGCMTPSGSGKTAESRHQQSLRRAQMQVLTTIWESYDETKAEALLSGQGRRRLREIMVAFAAHLVESGTTGRGGYGKHLDFIFDVDFDTTLDIRSRNGSQRTVTLPASIWDASKPSTRTA